MKNLSFLLASFFVFNFLYSQKKILDHSVYNSWQSIGERIISNDGRWIVYTIDIQEGNNQLVIQSTDGRYNNYIPRGYDAIITEDSRFVICKIKAFFSVIREDQVGNKMDDSAIKDSLAIIELGKEDTWKVPNLKSFKVSDQGGEWIAYQLESRETIKTDTLTIQNNLQHVVDSLNVVIEKLKMVKEKQEDVDYTDYIGDKKQTSINNNGAILFLRNLYSGAEKKINNVLEYYFNKQGSKLLLETTMNLKNISDERFVVLYDLLVNSMDTLSKGEIEFKNFSMTEDGSQVAYISEKYIGIENPQKTYQLRFYRQGMDSAILLIDQNSVGMKVGMTISENGAIRFSKSGERLFFATMPIQPLADTSLIEDHLVKLDIWHYNDDYLQPMQLKRLALDLKRSYFAVYDFNDNKLIQLGTPEMPEILESNEGDGEIFFGISDFGKRMELQWTGITKKDIYAIDVKTGNHTLIIENLKGNFFVSPTGNHIAWYDRERKNYFVWNGSQIRNITAQIKVPLYNEENDIPDHPSAYGVMGWYENDSAIFIYDKYDIWRVDIIGGGHPVNITKNAGRLNRNTYRYIKTDTQEKFIRSDSELVLTVFNNKTKESNLALLVLGNPNTIIQKLQSDSIKYWYGNILKARDSLVFSYTKENFQCSPDVYVNKGINNETRFSFINPQQKNYNWGTAELFKWKAYNGKEATGVLYKPENFDLKKKYPLICYFNEKLSNNLIEYHPPAPIRSAINISFFVSRGYLIFIPDIEYQIGYPGKSAYNYTVSAVRALVKDGVVDSTNMGIQGHNWGGYQVAELITRTKIFKAAWAGAPVANMTSAYGGIQWESGVSRQFQYEKSQSRIGATLWHKPQLYFQNSPLFHLKSVTTPLVIMHNDNDGTVPWHQGIELFTAMRRLGKQVWMLNYNEQGHDLTQRKDKLDYHIRMQQFFDWILKGEKSTKWITDGIPAIKKGKDWGLE